MSKDQSDVFICRLKKDDYWAYPSPFIARGGGSEIRFRNLTDDAILIDFGKAPVHEKMLSLGPGAADYVIVNGDALSGLYEYKARVTVSATGRKMQAASGKARRQAGKPKPILVKGGSPPRIIIDT